jgi:hydroxymethylpyrimidine/phosphomethylpyrimidine kinase
MQTVLTIAGSDPTGAAGIAADLRTFAAMGVHGASAITAVTAQSASGVTAVGAVSPESLRDQLDAIDASLEVAAVKIGLLPEPALVTVVAEYLGRHARLPSVLDPVLGASSGASLVAEGVLDSILEGLLPRVSLFTPNHPEAEAFLDRSIGGDEDALATAGSEFLARGARAVLLKGGHRDEPEAADFLVDATARQVFRSPRIGGAPARGTGCVLSAAIAALRARGRDQVGAIDEAKAFLTQAIEDSFFVGGDAMRVPHLLWEFYGSEGLP